MVHWLPLLQSLGSRAHSHSSCDTWALCQGSNPNTLLWKVNSLSLDHQGSPTFYFLQMKAGSDPPSVRLMIILPYLQLDSLIP